MNLYIYAAAIPAFVGILLFTIFKRKKVFAEYKNILIFAFLLALFRLAYYLLRIDEYTVSANILDPGIMDLVISFTAFFSGVAGGMLLIRDSKRILVKFLGLLFAVAHQFWLTGFFLGLLILFDNVPRVTGMTTAGVWSYKILWLMFIPLLVEVVIILSANRYLASEHPGRK